MASKAVHQLKQQAPSRAQGVTLSRAQLIAWSDYVHPAWAPFKDAWLSRACAPPPTGDQRRLLWEIADARPNDLATWVAGAPDRRPDLIVEYVLVQWKAFVDELERDARLRGG